MRRFWLILAMFLGLAATSAPAMADIQYTLNCSGNPCTGGSGGHNYGTVTLKQLGAGTVGNPYHVQVTVALAAGEVFLTTGNGHSGFTWNLLGSGNPSSITITSGNASLFNTPSTTAGSHANSPFSDFEYNISNIDTHGNGGIAGPLVFDIKKTGGLVLTNTLFSPNADGFFFAADIGQGCTLHDGKWNCASTGAVASNLRIPEPGTMSLSITALAALVGLVMLQRRRKLVSAA